MKFNKFVIVGVESTGKSTCAYEVARHFDAGLVTEYAREYLELHSNAYDYEDFIAIAKGQAEKEDKAVQNISKVQVLIFDTDFIVISIWAEIVFNKIEKWISSRTAGYHDRIYFVMNPDVEWVNDGLREYPELKDRQMIHQKYVELLESYGYEYYIISGTDHAERISKVIEIISGKI